MGVRICSKCGCEKPYDRSQKKYSKASGFFASKCWECYTEVNRMRNQKIRATPEGREASREAKRRQRATPEGLEASRAAGRKAKRKLRATPEGRAKCVAAVVKSQRRRLKTDAWFALCNRLRKETNALIHALVKGASNSDMRFQRLFGEDRATVKAWFESMFRPGLGWHNYQEVWTCDHWWPVAMAQDSNELRQCFLLDNCQVLTHEEHKLKTLEDNKLVRHSV